MPYLVEPSAGPYLRASFIEAMREHEAVDGKADADGLTVADLEGRTCLTHYTQGLREGSVPVPGTEPLRCPVWWWCDSLLEGLVYIGRVRITEHPPAHGGHVWYSVRPSRRGEGQATQLLAAALPLLNGRGIDPVRITCDPANIAARKVIEANGGQFAGDDATTCRYTVRTSVRV